MERIGRLRRAWEPENHHTTRTCVGCRQRDDRSILVRVVARPQDGAPGFVVIVDERRRLPGRGAWLHPEPGCLDLATRRGAFQRALRVRAPLDLDALVAWVHANGSPQPTPR